MKNEISLLEKRSSEELIKYTYYLITLSIGAIAYTINNAVTKEQSIENFLVFTPIVAWGLSFLYGNLQIRLFKEYRIENAYCLISDLSYIDMLIHLRPIEEKLHLYYKLQFRLFVFACCLYFLLAVYNSWYS